MKDFILYLFQSSVYMGVLYGGYWLFLRKETCFHLNRYYLLVTFLLPLILPILPFSFILTDPQTTLSAYLAPVTILPSRIQATVQNHFGMVESMLLVYLTGVTIFSVRLIFRLARIFSLGTGKPWLKVNGVRVVLTGIDHSPFSFINKVYFLSEARIDDDILSHERVHIREGHTIDVLIAECIKIFQWYNPFVWMTRKSLQQMNIKCGTGY
ncbi:MAG: hypothetical protein FJY10_07570 [Bacteroidetes bacterium]|nr:hypothetical protein [Bacteroidota bacterium]